ncbi:MAG TPA: lipid-binding SYLF domain-containing protein [Candidatus Desulfaltia sp.]|nr:lipid-binding SYLF domain-containing protein [Candidatus Desulfaltia sp.]
MKKTNRHGHTRWLALVIITALVITLGATRPVADSTEAGRRVEEAIRVFQEIADLTEEEIPESILRKAHGIAIIPGVVKAAYGIGGEYGRGVLLVRDKGVWSNPSFVILAGGSLGWQIGIQKSDLVLVFKTRQSIDDIAEGKITLGADASVAAGPVGRGAQASTDLDMKAEIYAYSKSKGLFVGISLKGAAIQIDGQANRDYYENPDISAREIFSNPDLRAPQSAERLRQLLGKFIRREISL